MFDVHKSLCFIPSLAIHLSDEKERGGNKVEFNKETQLLPIFGMTTAEEKEEKKGKKEEKMEENKKMEEKEDDMYARHPKELIDLICSNAGVEPKSVLDMDCYLYDMTVLPIHSAHV